MIRTTTLFALLAVFITPAVTDADVFVPAGLNPGDMYQLAFVTSGTITGTSPDILTYNNFVRTQAAMNPGLTGTDMGVQWFAIASTVNGGVANVNAMSPADDVFLLDGTQIASTAVPLYGGPLLSLLDSTQFAVPTTHVGVWTGSTPDGGRHLNLGLGANQPVIGRPYLGLFDARWIAHSQSDQGTSIPVYALSGLLTVPQSAAVIPEPASALVWLTVGGVSLSFSYCRRRPANRGRRQTA